jgi:hypothetical protein
MLDRRVAVCLLLGAFASSCARQQVWEYHANAYAPATASAGKAVVLPYRDARQADNWDLIGLYLIPILPYGWTTQQVPENATEHLTSSRWRNYKPVDDYPKALVEDLRSAKLFSDASFDSGQADADYVIQGTIYSTEYTGKLYSYGLGGFGPLLWPFGVPAASASNSLSVELTCIDHKSGRQILTKRYTPPPYSASSSLYSRASDFDFPELLASVNKEFVDDLRAAME